MATDYSTMFTDLGGAVSSLFGAIGSAQSAQSYQEAATLAGQQAQIAKESTAIQLQQQTRNIYQTISGQQADVAGAGLAASGSAQALLRSSASQGALTKALTTAQGQITATGYQEQANAYTGMASAAKSASTGGFLSSALGAVGAIASFL
jgi:hypothetical protein